jgi:hypothetical protein
MSVANLRSQLDGNIAGMRQNRYSWWISWKELGDFILPRRYRWLITANQANRGAMMNYNIIDSTGTLAARVLASGMMAGITSPTRPWFKLKIDGYEDDYEVGAWLTECEKRMMRVFQESNFYTSMAVMYFDLVVFGSACIIIYEDYDNVIHCCNPCLGEFFFELDYKFEVNMVGREFTMTYNQIVKQFGEGNVSEEVKLSQSPRGNGMGLKEKIIMHVIEPNKDNHDVVPEMFPWREVYWEQGGENDRLLSSKGFYDWPCMTPRWDVTANDPYGRSPGMDALGDIKQLQQEQKRKAQAIDKMVNPPMLYDVQLKNQPASVLPGGATYISGLMAGREGAKPLYQVDPKIGELRQDIADVQQRVKITFHNDLFTGITDLQTVRTATEIDARREEKLVLLGPVLERILGEGLGKAIDRVWGIMWRGRLLPTPPQSLAGGPTNIQIDYISMLAMAQKGLATASIEKLWAFVGNMAAVRPDILAKLDPYETVDVYGEALGVSPKLIIPTDDAKAANDAAQKKQEMAEGIAAGQAVTEGAKTLSETEVGGGINALQLAMGAEGV